MLEPSRICLWCQRPLPKGRRKYCCDDHSVRYWERQIKPFLWANAARMALKRAGHRCETCGKTQGQTIGGISDLEVHHLIPLGKGEARHGNPKNRQENLRVLCRDCHEAAHHPGAHPRHRTPPSLPLWEWAGLQYE